MASASSLQISKTIPFSTAYYKENVQMSNNFSINSPTRKGWGVRSNQYFVGTVMCESKKSPPQTGLTPKASNSLQIGSPIIVVEAPKMLKTAASVPCLRVNSGLVKAGDVGRIMSRKPKDVWAVRLAIGTYLIDGKFFKPLDLEDDM